jgi:hypothetical protein
VSRAIFNELCSDSYEFKVETSTFSSGASLDVMLRKAEELFAARFGMYLPFNRMPRDTNCSSLWQSEVIRNERWTGCVLLLSKQLITSVLSDQALRSGSRYQLLPVVFISVNSFSYSVAILF